MKKLFLFFAAGIAFSACTKTDVKPAGNVVSAASQDALSVRTKRSALLTAHPWIYQGFYFNYVDQNNKGDVQYERGGTNNVIDLDQTVFTFRQNGTFLEIDGGYRYPGTWHFTDNTATVLILDFTYWTDDCSIVTFTNNHLNYTQPLGYHSKSFTELIPSP